VIRLSDDREPQPLNAENNVFSEENIPEDVEVSCICGDTPALFPGEDVAGAVRYAQQRLLAWWENAMRPSLEGEAEELDARDEDDPHLTDVIEGIRYTAKSGEFEEVVDEILSDAFGNALEDVDEESGGDK
jgi:hypothetical protein